LTPAERAVRVIFDRYEPKLNSPHSVQNRPPKLTFIKIYSAVMETNCDRWVDRHNHPMNA